MLAVTTRSALAKAASTSPSGSSDRRWTLLADLLEDRVLGRVEGVLVGDDRVERVDVLDDQLERVLGDVPALGDDQRDRVAHVADLVGGERVERRGLHAGDERHAGRGPGRDGLGEPHHVLAGVDGDDPRELTGLAGIHRVDATVRHVAAQERGMQHPRQHDVVDVATGAGEDARVLDPLDPGPYGACSDLLHGPHLATSRGRRQRRPRGSRARTPRRRVHPPAARSCSWLSRC